MWNYTIRHILHNIKCGHIKFVTFFSRTWQPTTTTRPRNLMIARSRFLSDDNFYKPSIATAHILAFATHILQELQLSHNSIVTFPQQHQPWVFQNFRGGYTHSILAASPDLDNPSRQAIYLIKAEAQTLDYQPVLAPAEHFSIEYLQSDYNKKIKL